MSGAQVDFVIVGGGSAGSALANRLSADPGTSVLVLEAGRSDFKADPFIHMPAALPIPIGNRLYDWKYESEPEPFMHDRRIFHARGKVLGGSSSINGMIFQRGNPLDYERWAADPGMETWDYAHCLPYFKRMETCLAGADAWRGGSGPLVLERGPATNPLFGAFLEAAQQAGYPLTDDVNGYRQEGFARFDRNVYRGRRLSAARAYLHPVMSRPNLTVHTLALTTRIVFEETARSASSTPGRAGSTPSAPARSSSAAARSTRPSCCSSPVSATPRPRAARDRRRRRRARGRRAPAGPPRGLHPVRLQAAGVDRAGPEVAQPAAARRRVALPPPRARGHEPLRGGRVRARQRRRRLPEPDVPLPADRHPVRRVGPDQGHGYQVHIGPMYSDARGTVKIRSTDPHEHPALRFNYLSTEQDRREWVEAVRVARDILTQPAFAPFNGGELSPGPGVETEEQILDWVAEDAETALHPSCTTRMGTDDMSVLDPLTMRVRGVDGLRVVDASSMPYITNGNIYAPVMMLAEKSADLILGNTPLAPSTVPFYRYRDGSPLYPNGGPA